MEPHIPPLYTTAESAHAPSVPLGTRGANRGLVVQTNGIGRRGRYGRVAYAAALSAGCLALAGCVTDTTATRLNTTDTASAPPSEQIAKVTRTPKHHAATAVTFKTLDSYSAVGLASWYGADFNGRRTANGETFNMNSLTAAHPTLPLHCSVRVTNLTNNRSLVLRVNDRGPYVGHRLIDVSAKSAQLLGFYDRGLARVKVEVVGREP